MHADNTNQQEPHEDNGQEHADHKHGKPTKHTAASDNHPPLHRRHNNTLADEDDQPTTVWDLFLDALWKIRSLDSMHSFFDQLSVLVTPTLYGAWPEEPARHSNGVLAELSGDGEGIGLEMDGGDAESDDNVTHIHTDNDDDGDESDEDQDEEESDNEEGNNIDDDGEQDESENGEHNDGNRRNTFADTRHNTTTTNGPRNTTTLSDTCSVLSSSTRSNQENVAPFDVRLTASSPLGIFVRRCQAEFARLRFHGVSELWRAFLYYRHETVGQLQQRSTAFRLWSFDHVLLAMEMDLRGNTRLCEPLADQDLTKGLARGGRGGHGETMKKRGRGGDTDPFIVEKSTQDDSAEGDELASQLASQTLGKSNSIKVDSKNNNTHSVQNITNTTNDNDTTIQHILGDDSGFASQYDSQYKSAEEPSDTYPDFPSNRRHISNSSNAGQDSQSRHTPHNGSSSNNNHDISPLAKPRYLPDPTIGHDTQELLAGLSYTAYGNMSSRTRELGAPRMVSVEDVETMLEFQIERVQRGFFFIFFFRVCD